MKPLVGVHLKRFLRKYNREHRPSQILAALLQSVQYPYNVGSIFRLADGAGLSELVLTGITPTPPNPTIDKVGRHKSNNVPWRYEPDAVGTITAMREAGYHMVALELTSASEPYHQYQYPSKTCLVVGNEDHGVTKAALSACDGSVFLPMYGKGRSHNVHTALAIVVYHILHSSEDRLDQSG